MKNERLLDVLGQIDERFIVEAALEKQPKRKRLKKDFWIKWGTVAATLCFLVGAGILIFPPFVIKDNDTSESPAEGGIGHKEGMAFMSYAGPVFPLTVMEDDSELEARRRITWDFSTYEKETTDVETWGGFDNGIYVQDNYELFNLSQREQRITAVYPICGNFQTTQWPAITVNHTEVDWELYTGSYAGDFQGAGDEHSHSLNLDSITSWEGYQELLADGSYYSSAFEKADSLTQPVTVYELTNLTDGNYGSPATLCLRFTYDREKTQIFTYGFNGAGENPDTGEAYRDFFIREGLRKPDEEIKYLIVAGEDLDGYTLQGYQDGSSTPGEEIKGAGATVTRKEMTMGEVLQKIAQLRYQTISDNDFDGDHNRYLDKKISFTMYYQEICKHFAAYGPGGKEPKERYEYGRLDDIINEVAYHDRILYLTFPLTIPAGSSMVVEIEQYKQSSFDFFTSNSSENRGIEGYDMVTSLGSNLIFSKQIAAIVNDSGIEIVRQNLGFDLENGKREVELDISTPHYYLKIKEREE